MKQEMKIKGMSCGGCVKNVEKALSQINGVNKATVSLNPPQAIMEVNQTISNKIIQDALTEAGAYSIAGEEGQNSKKSGGSCCG
jgi:copper chaperone CopZ